MPAITEAKPRPPAVEARSSRCTGRRLEGLPGGEEFRPAERDDNGTWRPIPLDAGDADVLHHALAAITAFSSETYDALRTIPRNDFAVERPAKDSWSRGDTASTLRMRALAPLRFLARSHGDLPRGARALFLHEHLAPLIDEQDAVRWLRGLRSASPGDSAPPWRGQDASTGPFVSMFASVVRDVLDRMSGWYQPPPETPESVAWRRAFSFAFGIVIIAAVPLRSIYQAFHGTAAIETVEPGLAGTSLAAHAMLAEPWVNLLGTIDPGLPERYRVLMGGVLEHRSLIGCDLYASALAPPARSQLTASPRRSADALETTRKDWPRLGYTTRLDIASRAPANTEIYWAHDVAWQRLDQAAAYVSQAGFALVVTAANNRWGGKHPPHDTHHNGFDFDLDVLIPVRPRDFGDSGGKAEVRTVADLAPMQRFPSKKSEFVDDKGERFALVPLNPRDPRPTAQGLIDRLAIWVALQALQLVGMDDVLYADFGNMGLAARHLAGRFGRSSPPRPVATRYGGLPPSGQLRQLLEPAGHYNHVHAECPRDIVADLSAPPALTGRRSWPALNGSLVDWAEVRDSDPRFLTLMFGTEGAAPRQEALYRTDWSARWKGDGPALLPVWDPTIE
jgi:hypothetical protein